MNKGKYVFFQLIEFLDNNKFRHLVDKYDGNRYVKSFTCWNQLMAFMFGQLCNRESCSSSGSSSTSRLRNSVVLQRTLSEYKYALQS